MNTYLERLQQELERATAGVSAAGMTEAPVGKWSANQILEHLFLSYKGTNRGLAIGLETDAPTTSRPTLTDRVAAVLVFKLGYYPNGRTAPERTVPQGMAPEHLQSALLSELRKMDALFDDTERRFGSRVRVLDHPVIGPLTVDQWRKFHWLHGRHHAAQIRDRVGKS